MPYGSRAVAAPDKNVLSAGLPKLLAFFPIPDILATRAGFSRMIPVFHCKASISFQPFFANTLMAPG